MLGVSSASVQRVLRGSASTCEAERVCVFRCTLRNVDVPTGGTGAF